MAQKKITDLTLRSAVVDSVNFPIDDGIQSYRCTAPQIFEYLWAKGYKHQTISAAGVTLDSTYKVVLLDPTSASFTQNLPAVSSLPVDFVLIFKNIATNGNTVVLDANSTEKIDNALTLTLGSDPVMDSVMLLNTGTFWAVI